MTTQQLYAYWLEGINLLKGLFPSLIFNFKYLPLPQAIKLPIWIYKPTFFKLKGKVEIASKSIKTGMIRLGYMGGHMYPNTGIHWTVEGTIIFKGKCRIGNNSYIVVGKDSTVTFGKDFLASTSLKLVSFVGVDFGSYTRIGFDVLVMDTNFHPLYSLEKQKFGRAYGKISIGHHNWISTQSVVLHSVTTPKRCVFGLRSVLTNQNKFKSYCVHAGSPAHVVRDKVVRIYGKDKIREYT